MVDRRLQKIEGIESFVCRTGRAELDEHIIGVNMTEIIASFNPNSGRSREEILEEIREAMADIPGIVTSVEQPMAHLISAMLSGVQSQVAVKLYGDRSRYAPHEGPGDEAGHRRHAGRQGPDA